MKNMWKNWYTYLPYPRPKWVAIDDAIRIARMSADMSCDNCSLAGGFDPGGGGQAMEVDKEYQEVKHLESLKKKGFKRVRVFAQ